MLMSPNKDETAVHGCHCQGDMAVRMRKVLQTAGLVFECVTCLFANLDTVLNRFDKKKNGSGRRPSQGGGGLLSGVEMGVKLGKAKGYKRMGALGAKGHYKANPRPWDTGTYKKSNRRCVLIQSEVNHGEKR